MKRHPSSESKRKSLRSRDFEAALEWQFAVRDCRFRLPTVLFSELQKLARRAYPFETGGTLVGRITPDRRLAEVFIVLHANRSARRNRMTFFRPSDADDPALLEILKVQPHLNYIGEWHTHPSGAPVPSNPDKFALSQIANAPETANQTPVLLILGNSFETAADLGVFLFGPNSHFESGVF
jgi:integrative and conjugative element protein (TIGR02256 family)